MSPAMVLSKKYRELVRNFSLNVGFDNVYTKDRSIYKNNKIVIHLPCHGNINVKFNYGGCNNYVELGRNFHMKYAHLDLFYDNNRFIVGENGAGSKLNVLSCGNQIKIGNDLMLAQVFILCDGHAVLDAKTRECINVPTEPVSVGNHVWIGHDVILTAKAGIPDHCIVPVRSVVTKKFIEPNCLIAGNPASVKKTGIDWDANQPAAYLIDGSRPHIDMF
jgi:acetyltransferase-like isoleucine patch superfamily enzyme